MKIGIDANSIASSTIRGIGVYLRNIIDYIARNDHCNNYILYMMHAPQIDLNLPDNMQIKVVNGHNELLWELFGLSKHVRDDVDLFWGPSQVLPVGIKKIRCVLTVHDLACIVLKNSYHWYSRTIHSYFQKKAIRKADCIISVSKATRGDIFKYVKGVKGKVTTIYNGGGELRNLYAANNNILETLKIKSDYFLYIGAIESNSNKNLETIVYAFERIAESNKNVNLVIAGKCNSKNKIVKLIEASNFSDQIKIVGYISEDAKVCLLKNAASFLFPSLHEGFGIPIVEAMSLGTPVICSSNSSLPEVGGKAAIYLMNERDPDELASKMEYVLKISDEERKNIIKMGYEQASNFSWEKCAEETLKVLTSAEK